MNSDERPFFLAALALASITPICRALLRIADCGLRIADCLGEYLPGKKSAIRNPQSAMATAISHHDIDVKTTCRSCQTVRSLTQGARHEQPN